MSGRDLTNGAGTEQVLGKMDSTRLEPLKNLVEVLFFFEPEKEAFSLPGKPSNGRYPMARITQICDFCVSWGLQPDFS